LRRAIVVGASFDAADAAAKAFALEVGTWPAPPVRSTGMAVLLMDVLRGTGRGGAS
jgi:hypothetical protein